MREERSEFLKKTGKSAIKFHSRSIRHAIWQNARREKKFLRSVVCENEHCQRNVKKYQKTLSHLLRMTLPRPKLRKGYEFARHDAEGIFNWDSEIESAVAYEGKQVLRRFRNGQWEVEKRDLHALSIRSANRVERAKQRLAACGWSFSCQSKSRKELRVALQGK